MFGDKPPIGIRLVIHGFLSLPGLVLGLGGVAFLSMTLASWLEDAALGGDDEWAYGTGRELRLPYELRSFPALAASFAALALLGFGMHLTARLILGDRRYHLHSRQRILYVGLMAAEAFHLVLIVALGSCGIAGAWAGSSASALLLLVAGLLLASYFPFHRKIARSHQAWRATARSKGRESRSG